VLTGDAVISEKVIRETTLKISLIQEMIGKNAATESGILMEFNIYIIN
jgi:hypothetical protein